MKKPCATPACRCRAWWLPLPAGDATDAYLYMSLRGDLEICQACKPCEVDLIVRLGVPKADMKRPLVG